ncbi:hypothetical protein Fmac_011946 [Flemingia macrophylla]|uniref:non-specific serine/threonine protein kinase n=1 Tax=Flemingia macrophylla TaxID=520843 RepID=A0ABD1MNV5_9FABA
MDNLSFLDLSSNQLCGSIPLNTMKCTNLKTIDLSCNLFNGSITSQIGCVNVLKLSHNFLIGEIPSFWRTNFKLTNLDLSCNNLTVLLSILYFTKCAPKAKCEGISTKNGNLFSIWNYDGKIAFEDIIEATEDFHIKYCIGTGAYGSVYKAHLPIGNIVALKKLHQMEAQNPSFDKSFRNEIKMLTEIRHKNIIKLYGFCLHNQCMFLVYQYME